MGTSTLDESIFSDQWVDQDDAQKDLPSGVAEHGVPGIPPEIVDPEPFRPEK